MPVAGRIPHRVERASCRSPMGELTVLLLMKRVTGEYKIRLYIIARLFVYTFDIRRSTFP